MSVPAPHPSPPPPPPPSRPPAVAQPPMLAPNALPRVLVVARDYAGKLAAASRLPRHLYNPMVCSTLDKALVVLRENREAFVFVLVAGEFVDTGSFINIVNNEMGIPVYVITVNHHIEAAMMNNTTNNQRKLDPLPQSSANIEPHLSRKSEASNTRNGVCELEQNNEQSEQQHQLNINERRPRLVWTPELCKKFDYAYEKLLPTGDDVPTKILKLMNEPTLTRENVASHLQKKRLTKPKEPSIPSEVSPNKTYFQAHGHMQSSPIIFNMPERNISHFHIAQRLPNPQLDVNVNTHPQNIMVLPSYLPMTMQFDMPISKPMGMSKGDEMGQEMQHQLITEPEAPKTI